MTQADYILLDRSGSMRTMWDEAVASINSYVKKLAADKVDTTLTLVTFDTENNTPSFDVIRDKSPVSDWKDVAVDEVGPRGWTPLNDSVAKIVGLAEGAKPERAALIIVTDGEENRSVEFPGLVGLQKVKAMLDACRAKGWQVLFLGADFDNRVQAKGYGAMDQHTVAVAAGNMAATMDVVAESRAAYATRGLAMGFSDADKERLQKLS